MLEKLRPVLVKGQCGGNHGKVSSPASPFKNIRVDEQDTNAQNENILDNESRPFAFLRHRHLEEIDELPEYDRHGRVHLRSKNFRDIRYIDEKDECFSSRPHQHHRDKHESMLEVMGRMGLAEGEPEIIQSDEETSRQSSFKNGERPKSDPELAQKRGMLSTIAKLSSARIFLSSNNYTKQDREQAPIRKGLSASTA